MSLLLTKLKSESFIYVIEGEPYTKIHRCVCRDSFYSKWKLKVSLICYSDDFSEFSERVFFECQNYTRDTLSRRFREFREFDFSGKKLKLEKFEQFFFTN